MSTKQVNGWDGKGYHDSKLCQLIIRTAAVSFISLGISRNHASKHGIIIARKHPLLATDLIPASSKASFNINLALVWSLNQPILLA